MMSAQTVPRTAIMLALLAGALAAAIPARAQDAIPLPGVRLVESHDGNRVIVTMHVWRPGVSVAEAEIRAAVRAPSGTTLRLPVSGSVVTLPAGPSSMILVDVDASTVAPGVHLVEAAILDPTTGTTLSRDVLGVVK